MGRSDSHTTRTNLTGSCHRSLEIADFERLITEKGLYVTVVNGLSQTQALAVHRGLRGASDSYYGLIRLSWNSPPQWFLYDNRLYHGYRLVGRKLRLLQTEDRMADEELREQILMTHWLESGLFDNVEWEDVGSRGMIYDNLDTIESAQRLAHVETLVEEHMQSVGTEVLMRTRDLDPRLPEALYAAFRAFESAHSSEELPHVALSCRRFWSSWQNISTLRRLLLVVIS
jgi:hypothetical protein